MRKALLPLIVLCLYVRGYGWADEYSYDNGFYIGLGPNASHISRQKSINYGFDKNSNPLRATDVRDWAASPAARIGYKFDDANSIALYGDWARYSAGQSIGGLFAFEVVSVDGKVGSGSATVASDIGVDIGWKSNVSNAGLEYQRKLWSGPLGGVLGLLGFKYRYEGQEFDVTTSSASFGAGFGTPLIDELDERLREHLYGPYTGINLSFRPAHDSNFWIGVKTHVGYLFKSADFRARERFGVACFNDGLFCALKQNDHSSEGTVFTTVGLDLIYAITKGWSAGAVYEFNFINKAAHISNNDKAFALGNASKIENSAVYTNNIGLKLFYKF